jgi:hypothetical protein
VIPDARGESGGHGRAPLDVGLAPFPIDLDPPQGSFGEGQNPSSRHLDGVKEVVGDDGHHHVELKLPSLGGVGDGRVIAQNLERHHVQHLGHDRVHLAGHDGGARLHGRQPNLRDPGPWAGTQEPNVVGDFDEADG